MKTYAHLWYHLNEFFLRMRNASDKSSTENQNTHFIFNNFLSKNCATYEIMWKILMQPVKPQVTI